MIPFSPPFICKEVIDEVVDALQSGWITTGPKVRELEKQISEINHIEDVLCVNSWTSAAIMALTWFGLDEEDEVIIPAYTYSATALSVIHAGAKVVMVDVAEDFNMNVAALIAAITPNTKVIMPVDFGGLPADYLAIQELISSKEIQALYRPKSALQEKLGRILIVADAAHSFGARFYAKNEKCAADLVIYSLHAVKNISSAEGGALAVNLPTPFDNVAVKNEMKLLSLNCQTKDAFAKAIAGNWKYDIVGLGLKINMPDVNAAIAIGQLKHYTFLSERRKHIFNMYVQRFSAYDWIQLPLAHTAYATSSFHLFPIRIP
ncbi:MAG: aminotransferase class I/II-fold pyridoxal phosphate-dependent enzyme, partial [Maribacter sp.]